MASYLQTADEIIQDQWQQIIAGNSHHFVDLGAADFIRELSASFSQPDDEGLMANYSTQALLSAGHRISNLAETLLPDRHGFESRQSVNELFSDGLPYGVMGVSRVYCDYNRKGVKGEPTRIALDEVHGVPILGNQNVSDVDLRKRRIAYVDSYLNDINQLVEENSYQKKDGETYRPCTVSIHSFTPHIYKYVDGTLQTESRMHGKIGFLARTDKDIKLANRFIQLLQNDPLLGKNTGIKNNEIKLNWPYTGDMAQGATARISPNNPAVGTRVSVTIFYKIRQYGNIWWVLFVGR